MKLVTLACNSCGAPITVPESTKYLTCTHCGSQLSIQRGGGAAYTAVLEQIDERTSRMEETLDEMRRYDEVAAIDREWELEREQFMVEGKDGARRLPSSGSAVVGAIGAVAFGVFWFWITADAPGPPGVGIVGFLFAGIGVVSACVSHSKTEAYRQAHREYRARRERAKNRTR